MGRLTEIFSSVHVPQDLKSLWFSSRHADAAPLTEEPEIPRIQQEAADKEKRAQQQRLLEETSNKYYWIMEGKNHPKELNRVATILETQGFAFAVDPETNEISDLDWDTKEQDFQAFTQMITDIKETANLTDDVFFMYSQAIASNLLTQSPLYDRLNNDTIPRSAAHISNPFEHTVSVVQNVRTDGLNQWYVFWERLNAYMHDIGKLGIATADHTHAHAEISFLIWRQYFIEHPLPEFSVDNLEIVRKQAEVFLTPIRYHHLPEAVQFSAITAEDAYNLSAYQALTSEEMIDLQRISRDNHDIRILEPDEALFMIGTLSSADAASVDRYLPFAIMNTSVFFTEIFSQLDQIDWNKYPQEYIQHTLEWVQNVLIVVLSPVPGAALGTISPRRTLVDPALYDVDRSPFGTRQLEASKQGYFDLKKFAINNGIIH